MKPPAAVLGIGDNVEFHGLTYNVTSFDGDIAMLAAPGRQHATIPESAYGSVRQTAPIRLSRP